MEKNAQQKVDPAVAVHVDDERVTHIIILQTVEVNGATCTRDEAVMELRNILQSQKSKLGFTICGYRTLGEEHRQFEEEWAERKKLKEMGLLARLKRFLYNPIGNRPPVQP